MEPRPGAREPIRFAFRPAETVFGHTRRSGDGTFALDGFPQCALTLQVSDVRARRVGRMHVGPGSGETDLGTIAMNEGCLVTFTGGLWSRPIRYAADVDGLWLDVVGSFESRVLPHGILRLVPLGPPAMHDLDEAAERARDRPTDLVFDLRGRDELTIDLDELAPDGG